MPLSEACNSQPRTVDVELNYCGPMDYKPRIGIPQQEGKNQVESHTDLARKSLNIQPQRLSIQDASSVPSCPSLDREGFVFIHHPSKVKDFADIKEIEEVHFPEIRQILHEITGADVVKFLFSKGQVRSSAPGCPHRPAAFPHIDFSESGAIDAISRITPDPRKHIFRWGLYQFWRCLSPRAPVDRPLALLDAQSLSRTDFVPVDVGFDARIGSIEGIYLRYNPRHRWIYFSDMKKDDLLIFRAYDSARDCLPVAHVSFAEPMPGAHVRLSYELRAYVGWFT